jgi:hypothetical protein
MSLTKLSLAGNSLIIPGQGQFSCDIPAGDGKIANLCLQFVRDRRDAQNEANKSMQLHTGAEHFGNVILRYSEIPSQYHIDA